MGARPWLLALAMSAAGCAQVLGFEEHSIALIREQDFPELYSAALCDNVGPCCSHAGFGYDAEQCRRSMEARLHTIFVLTPSQAVEYDPEAAKRCVDAAQAIARECFENASFVDLDEACDQVYRGSLDVGAPCTSSLECAGTDGQPASCEYAAPDAPEGRCVVVPPAEVHGKLGDSCIGTCETDSLGITICTDFATCHTDDDLYCSAANGVCELLHGIGEACEYVVPSGPTCLEGLYCNLGVCEARIQTGACGENLDACVPVTAYCDVDSGQCLPTLPDGEACEFGYTCSGGDCIGAQVIEGEMTVSGECGTSSKFVTEDFCLGTPNLDNPPSRSPPTPPEF